MNVDPRGHLTILFIVGLFNAHKRWRDDLVVSFTADS